MNFFYIAACLLYLFMLIKNLYPYFSPFILRSIVVKTTKINWPIGQILIVYGILVVSHVSDSKFLFNLGFWPDLLIGSLLIFGGVAALPATIYFKDDFLTINHYGKRSILYSAITSFEIKNNKLHISTLEETYIFSILNISPQQFERIKTMIDLRKRDQLHHSKY